MCPPPTNARDALGDIGDIGKPGKQKHLQDKDTERTHCEGNHMLTEMAGLAYDHTF